MYADDYSFWQYKFCRYSVDFLGILSSNRSGVVEIDEFAVFPLLQYQYISVSFINKVDMIVHYDDTSFWISADTNMTLNDPKCPIQLKVRFLGCMPDVRML